MTAQILTNSQGLMSVEEVQRALNRSRASIYRYANTEPDNLNPDYDLSRLNPEYRNSKDEPILFHPNEVARFARDILGIKQVTIQVQESTETASLELMRAILAELKNIRELLESRPL